MRVSQILSVLVIGLFLGAGALVAEDCCAHNVHSHDALHGALNHQDTLAAGGAHHAQTGHCRTHGCTASSGQGSHADPSCGHDVGHNAYCAKTCTAHHATCKAACTLDHAKSCGNDMGQKDCKVHACGRDCQASTQKCAHCGHSHCGEHAFACHTSHHHVVGTHACAHTGCNDHCHVDGLRPELRNKVEEVRHHHVVRG